MMATPNKLMLFLSLLLIKKINCNVPRMSEGSVYSCTKDDYWERINWTKNAKDYTLIPSTKLLNTSKLDNRSVGEIR